MLNEGLIYYSWMTLFLILIIFVNMLPVKVRVHAAPPIPIIELLTLESESR